MNTEELRSKTADELRKIVLDLRKGQFNARFQKSQSALENTAQVRVSKRAIARAKTILNEKSQEVKQFGQRTENFVNTQGMRALRRSQERTRSRDRQRIY